MGRRDARHPEPGTDDEELDPISQEVREDFADAQELEPEPEDNLLLRKLESHTAETPEVTGGDVDAQWDRADIGEEAVGGSTPTPDQDVVDELGEAVGIEYQDDEALRTEDKLRERDSHRWELDPRSRGEEGTS